MARGTLRIYLGAAPGVGKTYAMLNEGWRRKSRGTDVVIGFVETHGRPNTASQIRDLEIVPRQKLWYRGKLLEEMDLDAVLARRPQVALVDELAHTNVPGTRNAKRWQDVEELLEAGITVISTLNIQHLESLNDVVENITGIAQKETVPDSVVRAADQIELVDMTPEALRRRLAHGNIYAPDQVDAALGNYFRPGNLAALRELALLWMADRVDEGLAEYRERHGIDRPWETKERVVVAMDGSDSGAALIRRAARMAARTRAELIGVHVKSTDAVPDAGGSRLEEHKELLAELGGTYREVLGNDVAKAFVQTARAENATQLVIGATHRSRLHELLRGSIVNSVIREASGVVDVHVISLPGTKGSGEGVVPRWPRLSPLPRRRQVAGWVLGAAGMPLLTLALTHARGQVGFPTALIAYLLVVMAVALAGGMWPALAGAVAGFLLSNYYFAPPIHTFTISNVRDVTALVAFLVVALVVSVLVDLLARREADAKKAREEARSLASMAGSLLSGPDPLPELVQRLASTFQLDGASLLVRAEDASGWTCEATAGAHPPHSAEEASVTIPLSEDHLVALSGEALTAEDREVLNGFAAHLAVALEAHRMQAEIADKSALARANELRGALLAAVSHDLRTPLATIKAAATSLLASDVDWDPESRRVLLETIDSEADRLSRLVANLLGMSRLRSGALPTKLVSVGLEDVVAAALASLDTASVKLEVEVPESLPPVMTDPALLERAVANLVDNAIAACPDGCPVRIEAGEVAGRVDLRVVDRGPGISPADRERIFLPFQRLGDSPDGSGVGLGLAVAKGFIEAVGGELSVEDTPGGGTTMVVSLPVACP